MGWFTADLLNCASTFKKSKSAILRNKYFRINVFKTVFAPYNIPEFRQVIVKNKTTWGVLLSLVPHTEALACPNCRNEQRRSPRRYVYGYTNHRCALNTYQMGINRCFVCDCFNGIARFLCVQTKAPSSTPYKTQMSVSKPSIPAHKAGSGIETSQN